MTLFKVLFAVFAIVLNALANPTPSDVASNYQKLCEPGGFIKESLATNGEKSFNITESCMQKLKKLNNSQGGNDGFGDGDVVDRKGFGRVPNLGKKKFQLVTNTDADFNQAQNNCKSEGKTLATILTKAEQDILEQEMIETGTWTTPFWIGGLYLNDRLSWVDSSDEILYAKWQKGFPKRNNKQGCVIINDNNNSFKWTIKPCNKYEKYVCEYYE